MLRRANGIMSATAAGKGFSVLTPSPDKSVSARTQ